MEINRGSRVGLNKSKGSYFFQGPNGINLREGIEETAIIPGDISEHNLDMIKRSISGGFLVVGWSPARKPNVKYKEDDKTILDKGVKKIILFLDEIFKIKGKGEYSPVYRLEKLARWEKEGKNRKTVIEKIEKLLGNIGGVSLVEEDDTDKEEIKINII